MVKKKEITQFQESMAKLKGEIEAIGKGVCELRKSGINETVLVDILHKMANKSYTKIKPPYAKAINRKVVVAVLDGIEGLTEYVFPEE